MFSGGGERVHWEQMGYRADSFAYHFFVKTTLCIILCIIIFTRQELSVIFRAPIYTQSHLIENRSIMSQYKQIHAS